MTWRLLNLTIKTLFILVPLGFFSCSYGLAMGEFAYYLAGLLAVVVGWTGFSILSVWKNP